MFKSSGSCIGGKTVWSSVAASTFFSCAAASPITTLLSVMVQFSFQ
jgi:hypothetical protein